MPPAPITPETVETTAVAELSKLKVQVRPVKLLPEIVAVGLNGILGPKALAVKLIGETESATPPVELELTLPLLRLKPEPAVLPQFSNKITENRNKKMTIRRIF